MKKIDAFALLAIFAASLSLHSNAVAADSSTQAAPVTLKPQLEYGQAAHLSALVLQQYHYKGSQLNDSASTQIFDRYLKSLDSEKIFFIQNDIDQFSNAKTRLDDAILRENLTIPFAIFNLYKQRISERIAYAKSLLGAGFDFNQIESYQYDREKAAWSKSSDEINDLWRKRVKNDWLRLKLAGKNDKNIVEVLNKRYDNYLKGVTKLKNEDAFQTFMNAYAGSVDPHSNYFGVRASEDFDISMKLSLQGIGAVLEEKDEFTTIRELVPGGPAALSEKLKVGDRIVGVMQGEKGTMADVTGMRLDDTVALIRGEANSIVTLEILPAEAGLDGKHEFISLVRKKISLDKQAAKKSIIEVKNGNATHRIGVITLPVFYEDFAAKANKEKDYKSATRDVELLIGELKKDKVDTLLIDLRNNGGGSLSEAINLTGLFIDQGPVLQERDSKGKIKVDVDTKAGAAWDKPMGVLINRGSASASEIFAAAIQDYGRGVIIGETSFGKGTVQTVVDLDALAKNKKPIFGEVKMTIAQFFRINGGTTQLRGVTPDIDLPSATDITRFGESSYDNALPWAQIKPADYKMTGNLSILFPTLKLNRDTRMSSEKEFQYLLKDIADFNVERKKNMLSLNLSDRQKEREAKEALLKSREDSTKTNAENEAETSAQATNLPNTDDGLQANERNINADIALEKANKNRKDILLNEAARIMSDTMSLLKTNYSITAR